MKKIRSLYVSGKITGDRFYRKKFNKAYDELKNAGYWDVYLPMDFVPRSKGWNNDMKMAIRGMLQADGVALLPDWEESKGAAIEARLAQEIGMPIKPIEDWINWSYTYSYKNAIKRRFKSADLICACTPFGKPENDWRPQ
jgi:hypothetical protein